MMENYESSYNSARLLLALEPDTGGTRTKFASRIVKNCNVQLVLFMFMLFGIMQNSFAQVASYTFAQSNGTYTAITGGTLHATTTDNGNYSFTLPFTFTYAGTGYTVARPTTNGFLVLGANAPSTSQYTPLSSGTTNFAISALGWDLNSTVRSEVIGTAPNRVYVCQWSNAYRYSASPTQSSSTEQINAQVRLYEGTNKIEIIYGSFATTSTSTSTAAVQVGLRGSANTDYKNRTTTTDWAASANGGANTSAMAITTTVKPASGLTYAFSPSTDPYAVASALTAFGNICKDVTSGSNSFTVTAGNLTGDITVGALAGYTYSASSGGTYTSTLTLTPTSGSLSAVPVHVKFTPTTLASYSGNIPLTGGGLASTVNVAASGTGVSTPPTAGSAGTVGSITTSGATISGAAITANGCTAVTAYGIEYSTTSGFTGGSGTPVAGSGYAGTGSGTLSATLSGLAANTMYYYRVYATNSGGTAYGTQGSFQTLCNAIPSTSLPWTESFDTNSTTISCWTVSAGASAEAADRWAYTTTDTSHGVTGPQASTRFAYLDVFNCQTAGNTYNLTSPSIVLPASAKRLKYQYYLGSGGYQTTPVPLAVEISVDGGAFTNIYSHTSSNSVFSTTTAVTNWRENWIDLTPYVNKTVQFRFVSNSNYGTGFCNQGLDQVSVEDLPNCVQPGTPVASAILYNGVTLTWAAPSTGTTPVGYEYAVTTSATPPASGTAFTGTSTSTSGLSATTTYYIHVRTNCGSGTFSSWSTSLSFTTPCAPVVPPYTNDFTSFPGTCWNANLSGGTPATGPTGTTAGWITDGFLNTGSGSVSFNLDTANQIGWLKSIPFDLSAGGYRVKFNYAVTAYNNGNAATTTATDDSVQFLISTDGGNTWTVLQNWSSPNSTISNTSNLYSYNLTSYTGSNIVFALYASEGTVDDAPDYDFHFDNFVVESIPNTAITTGDFATASNWSKGTVPVCGESAEIPSGITMTLSSGTAAVKNLNIVSGGALAVTGGTLTVGACTGNNEFLNNSGTINVSGGTLAVNGSIMNNTGSTFIQSAGNIVIDGSGTTSVASGTPLLAFGSSSVSFATGTVTLSGGTLTIVDPHTATTNTSAYALYGYIASGVTFNASVNHTVQFGDGISTTAGGGNYGFFYNLYASSTGRINLGNVVVNNPGGVTSRRVTQAGGNSEANVINGNLTITAGVYNQSSSTTNIGGNLTVEDASMFVGNGTTVFTKTVGTTTSAQTTPQAVTVNGTGVIQNALTAASANFTSVTIRNTSATGVTFNALNQVVANASVAASVSGTLVFDGKASTTGGKALLWGTLTLAGSTLTVTSGGMLPGSAFARGWTAGGTGATITASTLPTNSDGFPLLDENGNSRYAWINRVGGTATGIMAVTYTAGTGTSATSVTDLGYAIDTRSNAKWSVSTLGTGIAGTSFKIALSAPTIFGAAPTAANVRIVTAAGILGSHQAGTVLPHAQRTDMDLAELVGNDLYMGIGSTDIPFYTIQSGNWNDIATWSKNVVPTSADAITISAGHTVTVDGSYTAAANNITVNATGVLTQTANTLTVAGIVTNNGTINENGGTLTVAGASATGINNVAGAAFNLNSGTVTIGPAGGSSRRFTNAGELVVAGGNLNINGNLTHSGTNFTQTAGLIKIDGNAAGVLANSVPSGTPLFNCTSTAITLTGGTLQIVDPHTATTNTNGYAVYVSGTANASSLAATTSHITQLGDGVSTDAGGHTSGFYLSTYNTGFLSFGSIEVNGGSGTNRRITSANQLAAKGDLTVMASSMLVAPNCLFGGNLLINTGGTFVNTTGTTAGIVTSYTSSTLTFGNSTVAQTFTNNGTMANLATSPTANFAAFEVRNSHASGLTLNSPLSVSGTLYMTNGIINTTTVNLLSLGTATAAGTLSGGSSASYINGPMARTFAASRTASGTYSVATLFPVGKGTSFLPVYIDPTTASTGAVIFRSEAFTTNAGTMGTGLTTLSPSRWEALATTGGTNLTNAFVRLGDASIINTNKIVQSDAPANAYNPVATVTTYTAATGGMPNMLTTNAALPAADYKGYFAYGNLNSCAAPADQATAFVLASKTDTSISASYTAAASAPSHYLVVRYPSAGTITDPADYTAYTAGNALGAGTVVYSGSALTFNNTGLTANTAYDYYVYSFNNSGCFGPVYNVVSPLAFSVTTCAAATSPATALTSVAAQLTNNKFRASWTASATAGVNYIVDVATNNTFTTFVPGFQALNVGTATFIDVTGLSQSTPYYVRVRALAGADCYSANTTTLTVTTYSLLPTPWTEPFATTTVPTGWTASASYDWYIQPTYFEGNPGNALFIEHYYDDEYFEDIDYGYITTPNVGPVLAGQTFTFDYRLKEIGGLNYPAAPAAGTGDIKISVSTNFGASYTLLQTLINDGVAGWRTYELNLTPYVGQNVKFKIESEYTGDEEYDAGFDNFKIDAGAVCKKPTGFAATSIANGNVNLSWSAPLSGTAPTGYEYVVSSSSTPPASGTAVTGTSVSGYTGLAFEGNYYLHVRANCGTDGYGEWVSLPFYHGYCNAYVDYATYYINSFSTTGGVLNISNPSGGLSNLGYGYFPAMIVSQVQNGTVNLAAQMSSTNSLYLNVWVDWNNDMVFSSDEKMYSTTSATNTPSGSFVVPAGAAMGDHRMRVRATYYSGEQDACGYISYGEAEDYVLRVVPTPTCYAPANLSGTPVSASTANFSWSAPATAPMPSGYEYAVTTSLIPPASGTATTATTVAGQGGLTVDTQYYLHVRSNCGTDGYSDWATTAYLHGYCVASSTLSTYYVTGFSTTGGTANITNTGTTFSAGGYGNYTAMAVSQSEGNSVNFTATNTGGSGFNIWVDWNDDFVFAASERMYASGTSWVTSSSGSFSVPVNAIVGNHRMRIRSDYNNQNPNACGNITQGEAEDYTFTVLPSPPKVTSFSIAGVCEGAGTSVTITGTHFTGATAVAFNGTNQPVFTVNSATSITTTVPAGATTGTVSVTTPNGTGTSTASFNVYAYPVVADITGGGVSACLPDTVQLGNATSGGTWSSSNTGIATVNSSGLVTPVAAGTVTITYSKSANGCTTDKVTTVTFNAPVNITTVPISETVTPGSTAAFSVIATGTGLTYQWQVSSNGGTSYTNISDDAVYDGATTATLLINDVDGLDMHMYKVTVSGTSPCGSVTSAAATLSISDIGITSHPASATICDPGAGTASFAVGTTGDGLTFEWQQNSGAGWTALANGTVGGVTYSGADTNTLSLSGLTAANTTWRYRAYVQDGEANATSNEATLTVNSAPAISQQPENQIACSSGSTRNFTVVAAGTGLVYQWQYATTSGGTYSNVNNATPTGVTYAGATSATLSVTTSASTPSNATYYYRVVISGAAPCSAATSGEATLSINAPAITTAPANASVVKNNAATFTVATSAPSPTYQWQFSTTSGGTYADVADSTPTGATYSGAQTATLTVNAGSTMASGNGYWYRVMVTSGGCSVASAGARLTVTDYCTPIFTNATTSGDHMTAVTVAGTDFNSAPGDTGFGTNNYKMLTGAPNTGTFVLAASYTASITVGGGNPQNVGIWIDFNNDGDFDDTAEFLGTAAIASNSTGTITMAIPSNASAGNRRMRVRNIRSTAMTASSVCVSAARGTTVDYTVTIGLPAAPSISGFTQGSNCADTTMITINGTNLTGGTLTIGGVSVTVQSILGGGTQMNATVTAGTNGTIAVTTPGGTATGGTFTLNAPAALTLSSSSATICAGESTSAVTLTAGGSQYDTFAVTSVPAGAAYSGNQTSGFIFTPTVNTVYTIAASQSAGMCARSTTFTVTVKSNPVYPVTPAAADICSGEIRTLTAGSGSSTGGTGVFGTDVTTMSATSYPNPLSGFYGGVKHQMLFRINELTAQSLSAGSKITAVTLYIGSVTSNQPCTNFTIRMGSSSTNNLTGGFVTGTTTVYGPQTFTPNGAGLVTFTLTTPYTWDGTSHLVVEMVHNAGNGGNGSGTVTRYTNTGFNSTFYGAKDNVANGIDGFDALTSYTSTGVSQNRPNMTFVFANPTPTWSPVTGLYNDAAATVPYTGTVRSTVYAKPSVTTTYTATVNNGNGCSSSSQSVVTVKPKSWTGTVDNDWNNPANWCGGQVPTADDNIVISSEATVMPVIGELGELEDNIVVVGNSLTVEADATMTVYGGNALNITNAVIVEEDGSLVLDNYAHLLQGGNVTTNPNQGEVTVKRLSSPLFRLDYTMWSSPVEDQMLKTFSPETLDNRFYTYTEGTDTYHSVYQAGTSSPATTEMAEGVGYLIRTPNNFLDYVAPAVGAEEPDGQHYQGEFIGKPRSGNIDVPVTNNFNGFNAVGNPYPSPINIHAFYDGNEGMIDDASALYFWRKKNDSGTGSYARVTKFAYTANDDNQWGDTGNGSFVGNPSTWVVNPGQGFIVKVLQGGFVHFDNTMRTNVNNQQFFRTAQDEDTQSISRMWLNVKGAQGQFAQAAVGYSNMTTMGIDYGWDGRAFINDGNVSLFSLVGEEKLGIQARAAFNPADVVPMGYNAAAAGTFTISLDHMDGIFSQDQDIYLKDNLLGGITHDLKAGSYTFETEAGINITRFEVVYAEALGTDNPMLDPNSVIVYKQGTSININAGLLTMTDVTIYDMRGRELYSKDGINAAETVISNLHSDQQVLIIQINTDKGRVTKRIIF